MVNKDLRHVAQMPMDVPRQARALVDDYGTRAPTVAARKALSLVAAGDRQGYADWIRVLNDVTVLLGEEQPAH